MEIFLKRIRNLIDPVKGKLSINKPGTIAKKDVYCTCCNQSFESFLPFGVVIRNNALCPGCGSLERHRLDWDYISKNTDLLKKSGRKKILHVAPELVFYNKFKSNKLIEYIPCAKFGEGYEDVYPEGTINIDITNIEFAANEFDVIYCSHVLEHIPDDRKAMEEMYRVLKPGGWAMLQVPIDAKRIVTYEDFSITSPEERERVFGQKDHVRIYGQDYKERLLAAGFKVQEIDYVNQFSTADIARYGFLKNESIYLCTKL